MLLNWKNPHGIGTRHHQYLEHFWFEAVHFYCYCHRWRKIDVRPNHLQSLNVHQIWHFVHVNRCCFSNCCYYYCCRRCRVRIGVLIIFFRIRSNIVIFHHLHHRMLNLIQIYFDSIHCCCCCLSMHVTPYIRCVCITCVNGFFVYLLSMATIDRK